MMKPGEFDSFENTVQTNRTTDTVVAAQTPLMKKSPVPTSRVAKRETTRLTRQIMAFFAATLVLGLTFVFVIIPGMIRLAIDNDNSFGQQAEVDTIPPQPPVISAPPTAVTTETITITGFAEAGSDVKSVVNKESGASVRADESGSYELTLQLTAGQNTIALYAVDAAGNESNLSREYTISARTTPPELSVSEPTEQQVFQTVANQTISVKGTIDDPQGKVYLNDRLLVVSSDGSFSGRLRLEEGQNDLSFKAIDAAGNETEKQFSVRFEY